MLQLVELSLEMEAAYYAFRKVLNRQQDGLGEGWLFEHRGEPFPVLVKKLKAWAVGKQLPKGGWVPCSTFYLVDDKGTIMGKSSLRHHLNDFLRTIGGHIGYIIRPDQWRKGYGTEILRLTLEKARERGLERVLVTCDEDNIASMKIIEKNGGIFETTYREDENAVAKRRYWISL